MLLAVLGASAIATEVATVVERGRFRLVDFLSYFTIESNAFAVLVLLASVVVLPRSPIVDFLRGASTLFMATVFVVFSLLLADLDPSVLTAVPWDNTVLHYLVPIGVVADWLLDPPARAISFRRAAWWLGVPVVFVAYSLVRGAITGWYPYPFLNPAKQGGYAGVAVVCAGITVFVLATAWLVTRVRPRRAQPAGRAR